MIYSAAIKKRHGAIAPLAAFLMIFLIAMVAFSVDIGWVVLAKTNLQNAADAAALAGADPLMNGYVQYNLAATNSLKTTVLNSALANARAYAKQYAGYNSAGGVSSLTLNDSDIEFGFIDASNNYTPMPTYTGFPNTIKVTMRLDSTANKPLSLFFGPALGTRSVNVIATASATIYTGVVNSFSSKGSNVGLLPFTYDVNFWNNFLKTGQDPDGKTLTDANGVPELQMYPIKNFTGNFGQLSLDDSHVGNAVETSWLTNGATPSDVQNLQNANLIPLSAHPANAWNWVGDTGMKGSLVMTVNNYVGQTYVLPLFQPVNPGTPNPSSYQPAVGNGSQYFYNIVQFVGVQIMPSPKNNGEVIMQPAAVIDPNAVFDPTTVTPAGSSSQVITTFTTPKLTR
jgi:Flp pilus assembly protein TadG